MPAGRKTQSFAVDTSVSARKANAYHQEMRRLDDNCLHGVIFGCKNSTYHECVNKKLFGLPEHPHWYYVKNIKKGMRLFLFNYETRMLHGVFEAAGAGELFLDPYAWTDGDKETHFAAQVRVTWVQECTPIPERIFKVAIEKNYFSANKFMHELDKQQVDDLLHLMLGGKSISQPGRTTFNCDQENGSGRMQQARGVTHVVEAQNATAPARGAWGRPPPPVTTMCPPPPGTTIQGGSSSFGQSTDWDYHQKPRQQSPPPFTPSSRSIPDCVIKPAGWGSPPKGQPQSLAAPASQTGLSGSDFVIIPTGWGSPPKSRSGSPPYAPSSQNGASSSSELRCASPRQAHIPAQSAWQSNSTLAKVQDQGERVGCPNEERWLTRAGESQAGTTSQGDQEQRNQLNRLGGVKENGKLGWEDSSNGWNASGDPDRTLGNGRSDSVKVKVEPSESSRPSQSHRSSDSSSTGSGGSSGGSRGKRALKQKGHGFVNEGLRQGGWEDQTWETDSRQSSLEEETVKVFERLAVADQPLADALRNVFELSKTSVQQALREAAEVRQALETEWKGKVHSMDREWSERMRKNELERLRMERSFQDEIQTLRDEVQDLRHKFKLSQFSEAGREGAVSSEVMVAMDVTKVQDAKEMVRHCYSNGDALVHKASLSEVPSDIYLMGGFHDDKWLASVEVFNPLLGKWRNVAPMGDPRSYAAATVLDRKIFVFGGGSDKDHWFDSAEMYNPDKNEWIPICPLNKKRGSLGGAVLSGKIYAVGGGSGQVTVEGGKVITGVDPLAVCEILDPHVGRWVYGSQMQEKRFCVAAAELGGALYALGGYNNVTYMSSAERFDPREGSWQYIPSMSEKRGSLSAAVINGKIYAIGGYDNVCHNSVEAFDPRADRWLQVPPMEIKRAYSATAVIGNAIYCMGGGPPGSHLIEKYTDEDGWQVVQPLGNHMFQKKSFLTAAVL